MKTVKIHTNAEHNCFSALFKYALLMMGIVLLYIVIYITFFKGQIATKYRTFKMPLTSIKSIDQYDDSEYRVRIPKEYTEVRVPMVLLSDIEGDSISLTVHNNNKSEKVNIELSMDKDAIDEMSGLEDLDSINAFFDENKEKYLIWEEGSGDIEFEINKNTIKGKSILLIGMASEEGNEVAYVADNESNVNYYILFFCGLIGIIGTSLVFFTKQYYDIWNVDKIYILFSIILGMFYLILLPPASTNDSDIHIMSGYRCCNSILGLDDWYDGKGNKLQGNDADIFEFYLLNRIPSAEAYGNALSGCLYNTNTEDRYIYIRSDLSIVNPIQYTPYIISMLLGRLTGLNFMITLYLSKLAGAVFYVCLIWLAIKICPNGKEAIAIYALLPMSMQTMVGISYDTLCIGFSFVCLALFYKYKENGFNSSIRGNLLFLVCIFVITCCKSGVYTPIILLYMIIVLLLDDEGRNVLRTKPVTWIMPLVVFVLTFVFSNMAVANNQIVQSSINNNYSVSTMMRQPLHTAKILLNSFASDMDRILYGNFDRILGWNERIDPDFIIVINVILFLVACSMGGSIKSKFSDRILAVFFFLIPICLVYLLILMTSPLDTYYIEGIQGRYAMPTILILINGCLGVANVERINREKLFTCFWTVQCISICYVMMLFLRRSA